MSPDIKTYDKAAVIDTVVLAQELTKRQMTQKSSKSVPHIWSLDV